ncbi:CcdB family protein [Geotalea daltonii]|uniref:CcdB family protein n=1 Tax=Geotalea daltonii TaxID=1203471 RepID=UPI003899252A
MVYENLEEDTRKEVPFLLDVQHELHSHLLTRVMIPLVRTDAQKAGWTRCALHLQ